MKTKQKIILSLCVLGGMVFSQPTFSQPPPIKAQQPQIQLEVSTNDRVAEPIKSAPARKPKIKHATDAKGVDYVFQSFQDESKEIFWQGAWIDPNKKIVWGPIMRDQKSGAPLYLTRDQSEDICQDFNGRLPLREEYNDLAAYLGAPSSYTPYVLEWLDKNDGKAEWYWISAKSDTQPAKTAIEANLFEANHGRIVDISPDFEGAIFRCVLDLEKSKQ